MVQITDVHEVLERCVAYHGHFCAGQSLGVRIAKKGLELIGAEDQKDLIVFVENDRCIADAVLMATGTRLGRRSLKFVDYGKMAATFINLKKDVAYRVGLKPVDHEETAREGEQDDMKDRVLTLADEELLFWNRVRVSLKKEQLPGKPERIVRCAVCGEKVFDAKDIMGEGENDGPLCVSCAHGAYYQAGE
jgi:formylmethanofuran dehydrogenase subunit E